jgi:hypothetical protein
MMNLLSRLIKTRRFVVQGGRSSAGDVCGGNFVPGNSFIDPNAGF